MHRRSGRWKAAALALFLAAVGAFTASAAVPIDSYTYWSDVGSERKSVYNKPMFEVEAVLGYEAIGVEAFTSVNDVCLDKEDNIYILDGASRIVVLDPQFHFLREIGAIGGTERYDKSSSLYVHTDGTIYICHTDGKRVLHADAQGGLLEIITLPESPLIPSNFNFMPVQATVDPYGCLYVLSSGSYYGALLYSPEREFMGFYGANDVVHSLSTVLSGIVERLFPNNEKKANSVRTLPYSFEDIVMGDDGFVYTSNGYISPETQKGQIRKLSPGTGVNILDAAEKNFVDTRVSNTKYTGYYMQDICGLDVDANGFIYGLESKFGKVFVYDSSGRILTVFGGGMGDGSQDGTFATPSGIAVGRNGRILVSDSTTNLITAFSPNAYGAQVLGLVKLTLDGNYAQAKPGWMEIIRQDSNFQPAYSGLAYACLEEGDYEGAMAYARTAYDRDAYSLAFEQVRKDFINENFALLFAALVALVAGVVVLLVLSTRRELHIVKNRELRLMLATPLHPAASFAEIKEKSRGSIRLSILLVALYYVVTVLQTLAGGFMFTVYDASTFNSLWVFVRTAGLVVLWIAANWMVCTLLGGKGKLKELLIVTSYSLIPLIIEKLIRLVLTNVLLPAEASFLNIMDAIAVIYFVLLLVNGLLQIHDFTMGRLIGTSILSLLGVAAIVFLMILVFLLAQQFVGFIVTIVTELFTL